jgi:hypothetical protein
MAKLSMAQRRALPKSDFAVPSKAPGPGSYPIPDASHAKNAKARASQFAGASTKAKVDKKADKKLSRNPGMNMNKGMSYIGS